MAANEKISVIVPVYNMERFLNQCMDSLVHQSYENLEIIAVNDGSDDGSAKILDQYARCDKRIRIITQENHGLSAARNAGIDAATGTWISFIDADDYVNLDYYKNMIDAADGIDTDVISAGMRSQNASHFDIEFSERVILTTPTEKFKITRALDVAVTVRYLFRREFLARIGARFEYGRLFEDLLFLPPVLLAANRIVTAPGAYYYYVFNGTSILNRKWTDKHRQDLAYARAQRDALAAKYGLTVPSRYTVRKYKMLGITFMEKHWRPEETKYYMFGVRVLKTWRVRI